MLKTRLLCDSRQPNLPFWDPHFMEGADVIQRETLQRKQTSTF